jgi:hypothetical protein
LRDEKYRSIESHGTTEVDRYEQLNIVDEIAFEPVVCERRQRRDFHDMMGEGR